jgi:S-adenosylmethionine uptake transporter
MIYARVTHKLSPVFGCMTAISSSYMQGALWTLLACLISSLNDALVKGVALKPINILFFRFLFTTLTLMPVVFTRPKAFATSHHWIHGLRGLLFAAAMVPWCYSLQALPLPLMTLFSFSTPLFVTVLAGLFLKEKVGLHRMLATTLGFVGICLSVGFSSLPWTSSILLALAATGAFATLDIVNKRLLTSQEGLEPLMLYSALWTTVAILPLCLMEWQTPTLGQLSTMALLGLGGNAFFWAVLRAASTSDLSALQPFRYGEFFFSCAISWLFFSQAPDPSILGGLVFLIPATFYLSRHELRLERKKIPS